MEKTSAKPSVLTYEIKEPAAQPALFSANLKTLLQKLVPLAVAPSSLAGKHIISEESILAWRQTFRETHDLKPLISAINYFRSRSLLQPVGEASFHNGKTEIAIQIPSTEVANFSFTLAASQACKKEFPPEEQRQIEDFITSALPMISCSENHLMRIAYWHATFEVEKNEISVDRLISMISRKEVLLRHKLITLLSLTISADRFPDVRDCLLDRMEHQGFSYLSALFGKPGENQEAIDILIYTLSWTGKLPDHPFAQKIRKEALQLLKKETESVIWTEISIILFENLQREDPSPLMEEVFVHVLESIHWIAKTSAGQTLLTACKQDPIAFLTKIKKELKAPITPSISQDVFYSLFLMWGFFSVTKDKSETAHQLKMAVLCINSLMSQSDLSDQKVYALLLLDILFIIGDAPSREVAKTRDKTIQVLQRHVAKNKDLKDFAVKTLNGPLFNTYCGAVNSFVLTYLKALAD